MQMSHRSFFVNTLGQMPVQLLIDVGGGKIVVGGKLLKELFNHSLARRWLVERQRRGMTRIEDVKDVDAEESRIVALQLCESDDPHVIALSNISGARTLYTHDKALMKVFRCKSLIDNPRGSIYKYARKHRHLLRHTNSCGV